MIPGTGSTLRWFVRIAVPLDGFKREVRSADVTVPIVDAVAFGKSRIFVSKCGRELRFGLSIEIVSDLLTGIRIKQRKETSWIGICKRSGITLPAAILEIAELALPVEYRRCGRESFVEPVLCMLFSSVENGLTPEPGIKRDMKCLDVETVSTSVEEHCVGDLTVVFLG